MKTVDFERILWAFLIRNGYPITTYFALKEVVEIYRQIDESGINWEKTSNVRDDYDYEFVGTEQPSEKVYFLQGTIVTNAGKTFKFKHPVDYDGLVDLMQKALTEIYLSPENEIKRKLVEQL